MTRHHITPDNPVDRVGGAAGVFGPALFAAVFVLENALRTDDDAVAEPVSALSIGEYGWVQRLNFVVFGVLLSIFAAALHRRVASSRFGWVGPGLLAVAGAGLGVAATFSLARDDSGTVYDPSHHQVGGMMFFGGTALGLIALSRRLARDDRWRDLSRTVLAAGVASVAGGMVMNLLAVPEEAPLHGAAGLIQRIIVLTIVFPALMALGQRLRTHPALPQRDARAARARRLPARRVISRP
jgi:hypothetical protein